MNELIVESLQARLLEEPTPEHDDIDERRARLREALGDLLVPADGVVLPWPFDVKEEDVPLLTHEELAARMPVLDPPISQTVIEEREDRF
jgi:hypothetical protein